ncbi:MAG: hypothetical protein KUG82_01645 [Pseudomonadales bacterium]|nr:hypothetical protein [Pseudomonadales bacterium]
MSLYTYVVELDDKPPLEVGAKFNGVTIKKVEAGDAVESINGFENFLSKLRESTAFEENKYFIDDFMMYERGGWKGL